MEISNALVMNFENAIRGARNPMNSWERSDSHYAEDGTYILGMNDLDLARRLCAAGRDHRKFLRQIMVSVDIEAPIYWWKEFDTYKVGTTTNSTSTMHRIHTVPITIHDFEHIGITTPTQAFLEHTIAYLEQLRRQYLETKDKAVWVDLIRLLPSSYLQLRTCTLNYEVLHNMVEARQNHKLVEWHTFCDWALSLPYGSDLILPNNE